MDLRQLRHFVAVADTLHFGQAAERLHMTQPPLSQSIMALERELGAPLFQRTKRRVALTAFGAQWLAHVRPAMRSFEALPDMARQLQEGRAGHLALSFVSTADYSVLPALVQHYSACFPNVEIRLTEATSDVQMSALMAGEGQAGILIPPVEGTLPPGLAYRRLIREPLIAALPDRWVAEGRVVVSDGPDDGRLGAEAMLSLPLILFPRGVAPAFHDLVTGYYAAQGGQANIVQQAIQMQTIISLVSAGLGIALVPASLRNLARAGVTYVDLARPAPMLETGLAWRRDDNTPTLARFLDIVAQDGEAQGITVP